ncbi:hypothetical protein DPMN_019304 [Dreissena polymorpha]|uniref:Uncharacterized protein n=1 Tax=Dreissena polymorpha TaxID=45954 RepID=A0A9D4NKH8_DREPO|nr:hypothetical protein DPMN_019304 [Dreissena polymorpha]
MPFAADSRDNDAEDVGDKHDAEGEHQHYYRVGLATAPVWPAGAPIQNHPFPPLIPSSSHWTSGLKGSSARRDVIAVLMVTLTVNANTAAAAIRTTKYPVQIAHTSKYPVQIAHTSIQNNPSPPLTSNSSALTS